ncbi:MAG TPA: nitrite reductase small subunit NirD [Solirubrobacteraceae bacterium]
MVPVCRVDDVPLGEGRAVTVGERRVAVFHTRDGWYALDDACPHLGGPLADGLLADRSVTCPLHERRFDLRTGEALGQGCHVAAHRVELVDGEVFVRWPAWSSRRGGRHSTT